jgi:cyclophilin family peptidyl-prolyl cis-trans isomerase
MYPKFDYLKIIGIGTVVLLVLGCGGRDVKQTNSTSPAPKVDVDIDTLLNRVLVDRRFSPALAEAAGHQDRETRALAGRVLGRISSPRVEPLLLALLDDTMTTVRREAAFSAGLLGPRATSGFIEEVAERLASESDAATRQMLIRSLGNIGTSDYIAQISAYIGSEDASVTAAALLALARLGERAPLSAKEAEKACHRLSSPHESVRLAAAFLLAQKNADTVLKASCVEQLRRQLSGDASPEVRIQSAFALGASGVLKDIDSDVWLNQTDYRVATAGLAAMQSLKRSAQCEMLDVLLENVSETLKSSAPEVTVFHLRLIETAIEASFRCDSSDARRDIADRIAEALDRISEKSGVGHRARCLAYAVSARDDLEVMSCNPMTGTMGKVSYIKRLMHHLPLDDEKYAILKTFMADGDIRVARASVRALREVQSPSKRETILSLLEDDRIPIVCEGLSLIAASPELFRSGGSIAVDAVESVLNRVERFEPLVLPKILAAEALFALGTDTAWPLLDRLAQTRVRVVREAAESAIQKRDGTGTLKVTAPVDPAPIAVVKRVAEQRGKEVQLIVETEAGTMVIALDAQLAPVAVDALIALVKNGYFDGQKVEAVSPGNALFIGGPPGIGQDNSDTLLLEPSPRPVTNGTVAVRHTDATKTDGYLFVALRRMPELDGRVTVVGQIISGEAVLDHLAEGASIERVVSSEVR